MRISGPSPRRFAPSAPRRQGKEEETQFSIECSWRTWRLGELGALESFSAYGTRGSRRKSDIRFAATRGRIVALGDGAVIGLPARGGAWRRTGSVDHAGGCEIAGGAVR